MQIDTPSIVVCATRARRLHASVLIPRREFAPAVTARERYFNFALPL
jgi:hypothetical protein